ncbi:arsenic resistance protein [Alkalihalophilus sp. As8PL]|uniref:Arsenic resistance protein n=1 Tax=Alkalihalophilus sp. As8PL TaxID=3237103 RepID=A0AB39BUX1_9BACI
MSIIEKAYSFIIFIAVVLGIALGQVNVFEQQADLVIMPLLVAMLYITFLQIPLTKITKAFRNIKFTYTSLLINFIWTPVLAWLLAMVFLADNPALYLGFIMLMVTPCTDWYLIFTGIAKGNVALSTAILPLNLFLQVILLPVYLLIFGGKTGVINPTFLIESIVLVLLVPLVLALLTKGVLRNKQHLYDNLISTFSVLPILFLSLAIVAMFASQGQMLLANLDLMWKMLLPILLFFVINFIISQQVGKLMKFPFSDRASLSLTTLARNSPIALAIAMTAFSDQPLVALALVIGPLLELPILAIITQVLLVIRK